MDEERGKRALSMLERGRSLFGSGGSPDGAAARSPSPQRTRVSGFFSSWGRGSSPSRSRDEEDMGRELSPARSRHGGGGAGSRSSSIGSESGAGGGAAGSTGGSPVGAWGSWAMSYFGSDKNRKKEGSVQLVGKDSVGRTLLRVQINDSEGRDLWEDCDLASMLEARFIDAQTVHDVEVEPLAPMDVRILGVNGAGLAKLAELRTLTLRGHALQRDPFPTQLGELTHLTTLKLSNNQIRVLPESLGQLVHLTVLDVSENKLSRLPESIGACTKLRFVNVSFNQLTSLPTSIGHLTDCTELFVQRNSLTSLPAALSALVCLEVLIASDNKLSELPATMASLAGLRRLDLRNNRLVELCSIHAMTALTELNVSSNKLLALPSSIGAAVELKTLSCAKNRLAALPDELCELVHCVELDLSDNNLFVLPANMSALAACTSLNLRNNKLTALPASVADMPNLVHLVLAAKARVALSSDLAHKLPALDELECAHYSVRRSINHVELLGKHGMAHLIAHNSEAIHPVLATALRSLAVDADEQTCASLVKHGVLPVLFAHALRHDHDTVQHHALDTLCHIARHEALQQSIVDQGGLPILFQLIDEKSDTASDRQQVQIAALRALCNVASYHDTTQEAVVREGGLQLLMRIVVSRSTPDDVRALAIETVADLCFSEPNRHVLLEDYGPGSFEVFSSDKNAAVALQATRALSILGLLHERRRPKGRGVRVLSLDGGGTRGIVLIQMLLEIERVTGKDIHELFDVIVGTSTGAIVGFGVGLRKQSSAHMNALYTQLCADVFAGKHEGHSWSRLLLMVGDMARYPMGPFCDIMRNNIGDGSMIDTQAEHDPPMCVAIASRVNTLPPTPFLLRNYVHAPGHASRYKGSCQFKVWEALSATSSAPTFFPEFVKGEHNLLDGAIVANNPTAIGIHEAKCLWPGIEVETVVSLGTGVQTEPIPSNNRLARRVLDALVWSATTSHQVDEVMQDVMPEGVYWRFQPRGQAFRHQLDETRAEYLEEMRRATKDYIAENTDRFLALAKRLK